MGQAFNLKVSASTTPRVNLKQALDAGVRQEGVFFGDTGVSLAAISDRTLYVPARADLRRAFVKRWASRNAKRLAAGLSTLALVLPLASGAYAQEALVDVRTIDGVVDVRLLENGDVELTMQSGQTVRVAADGVRVTADGTVEVTQATADSIVEAVMQAPAGGEAAGLGAAAAILGSLGAIGLMAGGSEGNDDGAPSPAPSTTAYVVDGYIADALIVGDANGNESLDDGETSVRSGADGSFDSSLFADDVPLVSIGGIDISTGEAFTGTLKAPAGSTVVTPLTTLVQSVIENDTSGTPPTAAEAAASVASSLGLTGDLLNDDPVALAEGGDVAQLKAAAQVAAVINLVSAAAPGDPQGAVSTVLANLAEGGARLTDSAALQAAIEAAGDAIEVSADELAQALATANTNLEAASDVSAIEGAQTVIQGSLTDAVSGSVGVTDGTSALNDANEDAAFYDAGAPLRPLLTDVTPTDTALGNDPSESPITLSGTGRAGSTVNVTLGDLEASAEVGTNGTWSVTVTGDSYIAAGTSGEIEPVITATFNGVTSGQSLNAPTYYIDGEAPAAPVFSTESATLDGAALDSVVFAGTAEANATVTLTATGLLSAPVEVQANADGNWTTGALDLSAAENGQYTISAVAEDAAGNTSGAATASRTVDAAETEAVTIVVEGATAGELVLFDQAELEDLPVGESESANGTVTGVAAGTVVTLTVTGQVPGQAPFSQSFTGTTDADGAFSVTYPNSIFLDSLDGMVEAGSVVFTIEGETTSFEAPLLVNSGVGDPDSGVFLAGETVVDPAADAESAIGEGVTASLGQAQTLSNGLTVATLRLDNGSDTFSAVSVYDGSNLQPSEFYVFDGDAGAELPPLTTQLFVRGDELLVVQANVSGDLSVPSVNQGDAPLFTVYRVPANALSDAIPSMGDASNIDTSVADITNFTVDLTTIEPNWDPADSLPENLVFFVNDLSNDTGNPVVIMYAENIETQITEAAFLVELDLDNETVNARPISLSEIAEEDADAGGPVFDDYLIQDNIESNDDGDIVSVTFAGRDDAGNATQSFAYDYEAGGFVTILEGTDDFGELIYADAKGDAVIDGGDGDGNTDNDLLVIGDISGTQGAVNIVTNENGTATVSVELAVFQEFFGTDAGAQPFDFAIIAAHDISLNGDTAFAPDYVSEGSPASVTQTAEGFQAMSVSIEIDPGLVAAQAPAQVELATFGVNIPDASEFYALGFSTDFDGATPVFDSFSLISGIDGSGSQVVVLEDSQSRGGADIIYGFELGDGANSDVLRIEADFGGYLGEGIVRVTDDSPNPELQSDTGVLVLETASATEDAEVIDLLTTADLGLVDGANYVVLTGSDSDVSLWTVSTDVNEVAAENPQGIITDSIGRIDGLTLADLSDFGPSNIELNQTLPNA